MSKIALMTYWAYNDNYGQLFQLYALYSYLVSLGHDVRVIRYEHLRDKTIDRSIYDRFLEQIENPLEMLKKYIEDGSIENNMLLYLYVLVMILLKILKSKKLSGRKYIIHLKNFKVILLRVIYIYVEVI